MHPYALTHPPNPLLSYLSQANNMVKYVFLYLGPSVIQSFVVFGIFIFKFRSPYLSVIAYFSLVLYIVATIGLTVWRKKFRQKVRGCLQPVNRYMRVAHCIIFI